MRILFDQATPVPIRRFLLGHSVRTAAQQQWDTLENGDLLTAAEREGFDVFLTTDNVYADYEELKKRGIQFVEEPEERPYGIDSAFRDPSGNHIRLTQVRELAAV